MDFKDRILQLAAQSSKHVPKTEEATKNALILPFIQALGYDVFNLDEVCPEFVCDVGIKKGEKVDYAIMRDGKPCILFECKIAGTDLETAHFSQLYRYFSVTEARFGILTNGVEYRFFTDLDDQNRMDAKPFLIFSLSDPKENLIEELKKFTKAAFDVDQILSTASQLKYTSAIKRIIAKQINEPDEDFVRFFAKQVYPGTLTAGVREQFTGLVRQAMRQFVNDQITDRFTTALKDPEPEPEPVDNTPVVTTQEEHEAYLIVRAILREVVDVSRVVMRDTQSYCGVLLDDNNRKPLCRLHFNHTQKYIGVFDAQRQEQRVPISRLEDIFQYANQIKAALANYEPSSVSSN